YKEKQVAYKELAQLVSTATKTPANVAPTPIILDTKPTQPSQTTQPQEEVKEPEKKPTPTPIPDPVIPTPKPDPVEPIQPEPNPEPQPEPKPEPQPEPKPDPEPVYEAYLTVPDVITVHALSTFDIADYANAIDENGTNISSSITVSQAIDTTKVGTQQVYVEVVHHNVKAGKMVTIEVLNDAPVFDGLADKIVDIGQDVNLLEGVTATDTEEGDLTAKIEVTGEVDTTVEGTYTILYSVKDRFGAETTKQVVIEVQAKTPAFEGVEDATIFLGTPFDPNEGVTVTNMYEETLYTVTGEVDTATAGTYTLTYHAVNAYGKETTITRQITVVE
ncbi:immunoglobulin-like domain-containing protein, partial [Listeria sp. SHR_NRA_18]|uniref:immunoglobulin-like domain-containing protein n=1 Tax=Listeria sp. SHR_NRA_18 TaxID=2269046 RepID=UPI001374FA3C